MQQRKKILLVDDSKVVLMLEHAILEDRYDLITAQDGEEAVAIARRERPDLILMDVVMPRLDGFGATRQLRSCEETAAIPIVMVTTRGELEAMVAGYENGACDYVVKPIDEQELTAKVRSALGE